MFKIGPAARLAFSIAFMCSTMVWGALWLELIPNESRLTVEHRVKLTRAIAVSVSDLAKNGRYLELKRLLKKNLTYEPDLVSIGVRRAGTGTPLATAGPHATQWEYTTEIQPHQLVVDILAGGRKWGQMEVAFRSLEDLSLLQWFLQFPNGLLIFLGASFSLVGWAVLGKAFRQSGSANVVPDRVRSALDSISGGLVLVATSGEIAHANKAFSQIVQLDGDEIPGTQLSDYALFCPADGPQELPWIRCQREQQAVSGEVVESKISSGVTQKYMVSATPIFGPKNESRGTLVSFEDVTALESKKSELAKIIQTVRLSRDEVERQNEQLNFLASYDPLTSCMNRRSFFTLFEEQWEQDPERLLTVVMLDIDHFKSVNDNHGHSVGDEVLVKVGAIVREVVGDRGTVCRYGGEEFVVLLPNADFESNCEFAETVRLAIQTEEISGLRITTSMGISNVTLGAEDPQGMLDQADQCLYVAKRNGRNQLVRFDQCPTAEEEAATQAAAKDEANSEDAAVSNEASTANSDSRDSFPVEVTQREIEYSSVAGFLSALSFRNPDAALHCLRVADMAAAVGEPLVSARELYRLEIAALLHEVGLIGRSDLTEEQLVELSVKELVHLRRHDDVALTILKNAHASQEVLQMVTCMHHRNAYPWRREADVAIETYAVKVLQACDDFDAMVHPLDGKPAVSVDAAIRGLTENCESAEEVAVLESLVEFVKSDRYGRLALVAERSSAAGESGDMSSSPQDAVGNTTVSKESDASTRDSEETELDRLMELAMDVIDLSRIAKSHCRPDRSTIDQKSLVQ
jgi:diguanylate cyclase (GGDEF)-like protein